MKSIYQNEELKVFSEKEVENIEDNSILFKDGSKVDLLECSIVNYGKGDIKIEYLPLKPKIEDMESKVIQFNISDTIILAGDISYFEIIEHNKPFIEINSMGTYNFMSETYISQENNVLEIQTPKNNNNIIIGDVWVNGKRMRQEPNPKYGELIIKTPKCENLLIRSSGEGYGVVNIPLSLLEAKISGSTQLKCTSIKNLKVSISGSGEVLTDELTDSCNINISGSGKVMINQGELDKIRLSVSGSGSISANVIVDLAEMFVNGSGSIHLKHVKQASFEKCSGSGEIIVSNRG